MEPEGAKWISEGAEIKDFERLNTSAMVLMRAESIAEMEDFVLEF